MATPVPGEGLSSDVPPAASGPPNEAAKLGTQVGRFRALHQIGTGSLGPVFRGEDPDTRDLAAIKFLRLKIGPERTRLIAEELLALVGRIPDHPSLAKIIDAGIQDSDVYVVSELVPGEALGILVREYGPAEIADALPRLLQLAEALDRATERGIWHGALHPGDILVSAGSTRIIGLGIAQVLERARVRLEPRHPYSAPELIETHQGSPAADQYALAAVAHEWLFGRPVAGPAESPLEVPALRGVDREALAGAFTAAMAPSPADRFESSTAFVEALRASCKGGSSDHAIAPPLDSVPLELRPPAAHDSHVPVPWRGMLAADEASEAPVSGGFTFATLVAVLIAGLALGALGGYVILDRLQISSAPTTAADPRPASPDFPPTQPEPMRAEPVSRGQPFTDAPVAASTQAPTREQAASADLETARLLVRSTPAGASVTVDGSARGRTPVALRDLELGTRSVIISRPGYVPAERHVTLTADRPSRSIEVTLARIPRGRADPASAAAPVPSATTGSLLIESRPAGASVTINGRASGLTPLALAGIEPGRHTVLIERSGYRPWTTTVTVKVGDRARVAASLVGRQAQE